MRSKGTREEWAERVRAWEASGLSCAEFARRAKLHAGTLTWWRWRLATESGGRRRARRRRSDAPLRFVEIPSPETASAAREGERGIELEVGRVRLRVPEQFRPETLARVLEVLEGRS
jgi:hypothetical protein